MTVLVTVPQQQYTPLARTVNFNVAADATRMLVTFTHPNALAAWPAGELLRFEVLWSGISQGISTIGGGIRNDKAGVPIVGNVVTTFGVNKPPGLTQGTVRVTAVQTLTTAILVESF
jgi:hypothetical protein